MAKDIYKDSTRIQDGIVFKVRLSEIKKLYSVGDWVLVSAGIYMPGIRSIIGKIICKTEQLIVIRSEIGGYSMSYSWIDVALESHKFKKVSLEEAMVYVKERLYSRFWG